ncbi:MAG: TetR/AcrR family transcriptional regulator [Alphaproteobacteria bacterium]|nr:TetR/AcrR family transcriptional regulator [Alphaproteobacteria bacterium]
MSILTRGDLQQQTRKRLLAAAQKEIIRKGIAGTSIRDIVKAAGYTMGAFYSNFDCKESMLTELIDLHMREEILVFKEIALTTETGKKEDVLEHISIWLENLRKDRNLSALGFELQVYASRNAPFKKKFDNSKTQRLKELAEGLKALFDIHGLTPKIDCFQIAVSLAALWDGFYIHRTVHGAMPADQLILFILKALLDDPASPQTTKQKHTTHGGNYDA